MKKPNLLDRMIAAVSPAAGFRRMQYRQAFNLFDGASRGKRTRHWRTPGNSIQSDTRSGLEVLRARARDLGQNNPYAAAAHREIPANIIGQGIRPQVKLEQPDRRARVDKLVQDWFHTTACDAQGRQDFFGLQHLVARTVVESGEALVVKKRRPAGAEGLPLQIEVLEPDFLDMLKDGERVGNNQVIQGVEFNPAGQRVAYWLHTTHPGDYLSTATWGQSKRVPAEDVLHIFDVTRPGQVRGYPWGAPVILRLRDFDEYEDAQLTRQKIAACFSVFITPGDETLPLSPPEYDGEAEATEPLLPERVVPGMIEELANGKKVEFASPPGVSGYGEYARVTLHEIATGYGAPYALLTGDLTRVNFSSGRMGDRQFSRNVQRWQKQIIIAQFCRPVWAWFMEAAQARGRVDEFIDARWSPPRRELTDPAREIPAIRDAVRSGLLTLPEAIRQQGYDPDDFMAEVSESNSQLDDLGLVFDSDPRKVSAAGLAQSTPPDQNNSTDDGDA